MAMHPAIRHGINFVSPRLGTSPLPTLIMQTFIREILCTGRRSGLIRDTEHPTHTHSPSPSLLAVQHVNRLPQHRRVRLRERVREPAQLVDALAQLLRHDASHAREVLSNTLVAGVDLVDGAAEPRRDCLV